MLLHHLEHQPSSKSRLPSSCIQYQDLFNNLGGGDQRIVEWVRSMKYMCSRFPQQEKALDKTGAMEKGPSIQLTNEIIRITKTTIDTF